MKTLSLHQRRLNKLFRSPHLLFCASIIVIYGLIGVFGMLEWLPDLQERVGESYEPPSLSIAKIFGTDIFGRSILYKVLAGTETAVTLGLIVSIIALPIGIILGALAGYFGGFVDTFITWLYTVIASVPSILLIIAISYSLGKGLMAICIAMAATYWIGLCRMVRGEYIKLKDSEYVLASRMLGASHTTLIFKHILPNVLHIPIISGSLMVLSAIKAEVMLTYIGVGVQDGASWGTMIAAAPGELTNGMWWPLATVVLAMFLVIYALNVIGDALRDILDPKIL